MNVLDLLTNSDLRGLLAMTQRVTDMSRYDEAGGMALARRLPGRILWLLPDGTVWELTEDTPPGMLSTCEECNDSVDVMAIVREHRPCGHVTANGFTTKIEPECHCPKCDERTTSLESMPRVGDVRICGGCGKLSNRKQTNAD